MSRTFFRKFFRPSRGPRGVPPSGLRPFAAASSALYAPPAPRVRETRPHTGCRQLQRGGAEGMAGGSDGRAASGWRFALPRMRGRPGALAREAPNPPGRPTQPHASSCLYIGRKIGHAFRPRALPPSSCKLRFPLSLALPHSPSSNFSRSEYQPWLLSTAKGTPKSSVMQSPVRSSSFLPSA